MRVYTFEKSQKAKKQVTVNQIAKTSSRVHIYNLGGIVSFPFLRDFTRVL